MHKKLQSLHFALEFRLLNLLYFSWRIKLLIITLVVNLDKLLAFKMTSRSS